MKIKICGLTTFEDASLAVEAGADYLGFIFYPPSPRRTTRQDAAEIVKALQNQYGSDLPYLVGVFVNESVSSIERIMYHVGLNLAQLSGDESPQALEALAGKAYKGIRPRSLTEARADVEDYALLGAKNEHHPNILLDAHHPELYGGTGQQVNPEIVDGVRALSPRMMLAGGLTPDNVAAFVATFQPFAIDVASGVEAEPGLKDPQKVRDFIVNAREVL